MTTLWPEQLEDSDSIIDNRSFTSPNHSGQICVPLRFLFNGYRGILYLGKAD